nr:Hypothetical protein CBG24691 [Haemonchus contortus]
MKSMQCNSRNNGKFDHEILEAMQFNEGRDNDSESFFEESTSVLPTAPARDRDHIGLAQIDATNAWPPRASIAQVDVLYLSDRDRFFVTQIPIKVNGIRVLALVDTGASITITTAATAPLLGVFSMEKSDVTSAVGMAGVPVRLLGCASLAFEIGSLTFDHPVFFTDSACIPGVADAYNIILGNDLLRKTASLDHRLCYSHLFYG